MFLTRQINQTVFFRTGAKHKLEKRVITKFSVMFQNLENKSLMKNEFFVSLGI